MKYKDVVKFDRIIDVIQLREAEDRVKAENLVKSYVISQGMAEKIVDVVFKHLQFDNPSNNKGLFIVGNYGTGKSHLMSLISSIAENAELAKFINSDVVREKSSGVVGRFKVIRDEIGGSKNDLRGIIFDILKNYLIKENIDYKIPDSDKVINNKIIIVEMMAEFEKKYPDKGLLLIVDELLDYLGGRKEQEVRFDLNVLRELGEASDITRFRFVTGIQESLYDNPKFQYAAESIMRVKDRFAQIVIARDDLEYVISERLLKKDEEQKKVVREHLEKFTSYYENLSVNMDKFVSLYPVHPAFLDIFERLYFAEKRVMLTTVSKEMEMLMEKDIPLDSPGTISYDVYWKHIKEDSSYKTMPDVSKVLEKNILISNKVNSLPKTKDIYKPTALSIIDALSVHRLSTGDITLDIGLTSQELRDDLFLFLKMPEQGGEFLKSTIDVIMNDIIKVVNRQFVKQNKDNQQYYIALTDIPDLDFIIEQRIGILEDDKLNRYYFEILERMLEKGGITPKVNGFKIWEHEFEWKAKRVNRKGYLFLGNPDERSTAQPPRDFYIYLFNYFGDKYKIKEPKKDEIYIYLSNPPEDFEEKVKLYAAASEEYKNSPKGATAEIFRDKMESYMLEAIKLLRENPLTAFSAHFMGQDKKLHDYLKDLKDSSADSFKEIIDSISSHCLSAHFKEKYPQYPSFKMRITYESIKSAAQDALDYLGSHQKTMGRNVLDAFGLLDEMGYLQVLKSDYTKYFIDLLSSRDKGQVINRGEILEEMDTIWLDKHFKLEVEWVSVLLAALIHSGHIIVTCKDKTLDGSNFSGQKDMSLSDLMEFKAIKRPSELPLAEITLLYKKLGIPEAMIKDESKREEGVKLMLEKTNEHLDSTLKTLEKIDRGVSCWGGNILGVKAPELKEKLSQLKVFLENLQKYNKVPKLKNLSVSCSDIEKLMGYIGIIKHVNDLEDMSNWINPYANYLSVAMEKLPVNHVLKGKITEAQTGFIDDITKSPSVSIFKDKWLPVVRDLKAEYIKEYISLHNKCRLDYQMDQKKKKILESDIWKSLHSLKGINIMAQSELDTVQNKLLSIQSCPSLTEKDLENSPICEKCRLNPSEAEIKDMGFYLDDLERSLERIYDNWQRSLMNELAAPGNDDNINLLEEEKKEAVKEFKESGKFPDQIDANFIKAVNEVLGGLEKIELSLDDIRKALTGKGEVCNKSALLERFTQMVEEKVKGRDNGKIRFVLKS